MYLNIGTPTTIDFPFGTNGKLMVLGVPILKHFRVYIFCNIGYSNNNIIFFLLISTTAQKEIQIKDTTER